MQIPRQQWIALAGIFGGACWIISGMRLLPPVQTDPRLHAIALWPLVPATCLLGIALLGVYRRWPVQRRRSAQIGLGFSCSGLGLLCIATLTLLLTRWLPITVLSAAGSLLLNIGLVLLGSAIMQHADRAGWQALPLAQGLLGLFLPIGAGVDGVIGFTVWIIWGIGWLWQGSILWLERAAPATPQRVTARRH